MSITSSTLARRSRQKLVIVSALPKFDEVFLFPHIVSALIHTVQEGGRALPLRRVGEIADD